MTARLQAEIDGVDMVRLAEETADFDLSTDAATLPDSPSPSSLPLTAPVTITPDILTLLTTLLSQQNEASQANLLLAIQEMKKPNAKAQAKEDADEAREYALMMQRINEAKRQEEDQAAAQLTCSHTRPDGKTRLRAQVLTNGYSQAFCPECHALSAPFACAAHELTGGMNMDGWGGQAWAIVQQRVKTSPPPPPVPRLPPGARIQF